MYKLIITLTLLSACSIYPSANSAAQDEKETQQQLSIIRSQNASASATATASASAASAGEFESKSIAALPLIHPASTTQAQTTVQLNRIMEALAPVYGDEADQDETAKIAQLISEYAGKLERSEFPARTARITEALTPVFGSASNDIAPIISAYAGPCPPTFAQRSRQIAESVVNFGHDAITPFYLPTSGIFDPNNHNYLNRFADWTAGRLRTVPITTRVYARVIPYFSLTIIVTFTGMLFIAWMFKLHVAR